MYAFGTAQWHGSPCVYDVFLPVSPLYFSQEYTKPTALVELFKNRLSPVDLVKVAPKPNVLVYS